MTERVRTVMVGASSTIAAAMAAIDAGRAGIALVVDDKGRLLGTVTDGDVRRALLRRVLLSAPVSEVMNTRFKAAPLGLEREEQRRIMLAARVRQLPLLDEEGRVCDLLSDQDFVEQIPEVPSVAVIMAGGEGRRLRPLTAEVPKPMLPLGRRPLLALLVERLASQGIRNVYISVNYLRHVIRDYFGNGSAFGVRITYLEEQQPLGTAGALAQLAGSVRDPILVMNGDLVTTLDFTRMLQHHRQAGYLMTVGTRALTIEVPFGVLEVSGQEVRAIREKPQQQFFISCGVYTLEPQLLNRIPVDSYFDMPALIQEALRAGKVGAFPIHEYWRDIGRPDEYYRVVDEWARRTE